MDDDAKKIALNFGNNPEELRTFKYSTEANEGQCSSEQIEGKGKRKKDGTSLMITSLALSVFRIIVSCNTYSVFLSPSGTWTEGKVYGYFTGDLNYLFMAVILILNIIATVFQTKNHTIGKLIILFLAWLALFATFRLTLLILSYSP